MKIKQRLVNITKKYHMVYEVYYFVMTFLVKILNFFVKNDNKSCLFVCSGGHHYSGNVRPVYEWMIKDKRYNDWRFVWAFDNPRLYSLPDNERTKICKIDSLDFYKSALKAKCWITDVSVQRGLNFKNKNTIYVNTWHGVPIKALGNNNKVKNYTLKNKEQFDLMTAAGNYDKPILASAFSLDESKIKCTGYPVNDVMFEVNQNEVKSLTIKDLNLSDDNKVILYAPTYRDYLNDAKGDVKFELNLNPNRYYNKLGGKYTLLVRAHSSVNKDLMSVNGFVDVSKYKPGYNLLMTADILISDYSGIIFEYALLEKPIILYIYDYEKYKENRGLSVDIEKEFPFQKCKTEDELYEVISNLDYEKECEITRRFKKKYGLIEQGATENVVNEISKLLGV